VGIGRMTHETLEEIHDKMALDLRNHGLEFSDIYVCTDASEESTDRKPNPGMLLRAAAKHHLDLKASWMVGDSEKDMVAGKRAGCRTVLVSSKNKPTVADYRISHIKELADFLSKQL
jgi:histidinol-phosphate phosphatase family protein